MNTSRLAYLTLLTGALLWCAALLLAPLLAAMPGPFARLGDLIYRFFHPVCHQLDGRSLHLFGGALAVCSRCSAIYLAFLGGTILYPAIRNLDDTSLPNRVYLGLCLAPIIIDGTFGGGILYQTTNIIRLITGALAGAALPFYVLPTAIDAARQLGPGRRLSTIHHSQKGLHDA